MKANPLQNKRRHSRSSGSTAGAGVHFMTTLDLGLKLILSIVFLMLTAVFFILIHDLLVQGKEPAIRQISISGNRHLTRSEILNQCGIDKGDNILALNTHLAEKKLTAHPWVRSARIKRHLPRQITITVREHRPVARMDATAGARLLINDLGVPFATAEASVKGNLSHLPLLSGVGLDNADGSWRLSSPLLDKVMSLLTPINAPTIQVLHADPLTGISVELTHTNSSVTDPGAAPAPPVTLKLGFTDYGDKFRKADMISRFFHSRYPGTAVLTMDLYTPQRVVVTLDTPADPDGKAPAKGV